MSVDQSKVSVKSAARVALGSAGPTALAFLMLASGWLHGQQVQQPPQTQQPTYSTGVKVVNVLATVRNKQGQIVQHLTKDDFTLAEDNRPQTIRYFAEESDLPLSVGLLVDTSLSMARVLDEERSASYTFLDQMLREKDVAFVIHFEGQVELLQDLTSSRQDLEKALDLLRTPQLQRSGGGGYGTPFAAVQWPGQFPGQWPGGGGGQWPGGGRGQGRRMPGNGRGAGGGTALYDAVFLASDEVIRKQSGRKALIVLSDGVDNASKVSLDRAIEAALRADTVVYSIRFHDDSANGFGGGFGGMGGGMGRRGGGYPSSYPPRPDGKKVLERLSNETGGRYFDVSKKQTVSQIYSIIEEELRNQYSLGYTPDQTEAGPPYHKILVTTRQKDLTVRARDGYYAQ